MVISEVNEDLDRLEKSEDVVNSINDLVIVGYYTMGTEYRDEARKTIASCKKLGLNYYIIGVPNLKSWQKNTRHKSKLMIHCIEKFKDNRLLYVDCDAIIHKIPELFKGYQADIAIRWQDFAWRVQDSLSGTIYMEPTEKSLRLCEMWDYDNLNQTEGSNAIEQWNLGDKIKYMQEHHNLDAKNLPPEYTFIFDHMRKIYPDADPVIEHFQASRKYRHKLDK